MTKATTTSSGMSEKLWRQDRYVDDDPRSARLVMRQKKAERADRYCTLVPLIAIRGHRKCTSPSCGRPSDMVVFGRCQDCKQSFSSRERLLLVVEVPVEEERFLSLTS